MEFSYVDQLTMAFTNNKERDGLLVSVLDQFRKALRKYQKKNLIEEGWVRVFLNPLKSLDYHFTKRKRSTIGS